MGHFGRSRDIWSGAIRNPNDVVIDGKSIPQRALHPATMRISDAFLSYPNRQMTHKIFNDNI
jgi:hypothetical protein